MAYEHAMRRGISKHPRFLSLDQAYHGDTVGAVSLGQVPLFHRSYDRLLFRTDKVMSPYCYRCPFNRAKAERGDARLHRRCQWECVQTVERKLEQAQTKGQAYAGWVVEPVVQGVAGMVVQPEGWLKRMGRLARQAGIPHRTTSARPANCAIYPRRICEQQWRVRHSGDCSRPSPSLEIYPPPPGADPGHFRMKAHNNDTPFS